MGLVCTFTESFPFPSFLFSFPLAGVFAPSVFLFFFCVFRFVFLPLEDLFFSPMGGFLAALSVSAAIVLTVSFAGVVHICARNPAPSRIITTAAIQMRR